MRLDGALSEDHEIKTWVKQGNGPSLISLDEVKQTMKGNERQDRDFKDACGEQKGLSRRKWHMGGFSGFCRLHSDTMRDGRSTTQRR